MASIITMEEPTIYEPTKTLIDTGIIEFIYVSNLDDLLADDELMDLILSNGYYKSALCEAQGLEKLEISHKEQVHLCMTTPDNISCILDLVEGKTICKALDVELTNKSL